MKANIRRLNTVAADFEAQFQALQHWSAETDADSYTHLDLEDVFLEIMQQGGEPGPEGLTARGLAPGVGLTRPAGGPG